MSAVAALLPDGRLHLQHGPIDCLCRVWGDPAEVRAAYRQAAAFFADLLDGLCDELPLLRAVLPGPGPSGAIARAMHAACLPFAGGFITPMAAVAGAVADAVLAAMVAGRDVTRGFVNNGGDIAFFLAPGESLRCGLVTDLGGAVATPPDWPAPFPAGSRQGGVAPVSWPSLARPPPTSRPAGVKVVDGRAKLGHDTGGASPVSAPTGGHITPTVGHTTPPALDGTFLLTADHPARGLATSGRACKGQRGRSFSFGIADSVTVLARTAAEADAAATIIGNAVDLPNHPAIRRRPANEIDPASDLGDRMITFDLGPLSDTAVREALDAGAAKADALLRGGRIHGSVLALRGQLRVCHPAAAVLEPA